MISKKTDEGYKAYLEGITARKSGGMLSSNPYWLFSEQHETMYNLWAKGWLAEEDCLVAGI